MNRVFITLSFLMGVVVLTSNYLVQFPINYFGLNEILTYGAFSYPIAFLITDISNRFYGKIYAKKIVYIGFIFWYLFYTFIFYKFCRFNLNKNCNWFRYSFYSCSIDWCSNFWSAKKKKVVCGTFNIIFNWIYCWYFFIFFNIFLCNRNTLV